MAKVLVLTAMTGSQIGKKYTLTGRGSIIGSAPSAEMQVVDRTIDARHAEVRTMLDSWFIVPLAGGGVSVNGSIVGGQGRIRPGDKVTIGLTTYQATVEELAEREVGAPQPQSGVPRLGDYLVQRGIMTADQVRRTAERQAALSRTGMSKQFGEVAYELGYLNRTQLDRIVAEQRSDFNDRWRD